MKEIFRIFKPKKVEEYTVLLIAIYLMATFLSYHIPTAICYGLKVVTGISFLLLVLKNLKNNPIKGFTGFMYSTLVFWTLILVVRFLIIDEIEDFQGASFNKIIGDTFMTDNFLPYMLPLILLCLGNNCNIAFRYFLNVSKWFGILFVILLPFAIRSMLTYKFDPSISLGEGGYSDFVNNSTFGIISLLPAFVMIYFKKYFTKKVWWIYMIALIGALFIGLYMARRGRSAMYMLYFVTCWMLYLFCDRKSSKLVQIASIIIIAILCYAIFSSTQDSLFSILMERGMTDTRSGVEENMIADMNGWDWIIGRGYFGEYYDPMFGYNRPDIESGYLALILKGGLIYLVCFVGVLLTSAYKGLFNSNNLFVKAFAIIMIMAVIDLYPFGWPKFNFHYFTVWIGVYICNKPTYRRLTDEQVYNMYFKKIK